MKALFVGISLALGLLATPTFAQINGWDCDAGGDVPTTGPTVVILAPSPGALLAPESKLTVAAFDCHADTGIGVDKVSIFLGLRGDGGIHLGDAQGGAPSGVHVVPATQFGLAGWTLSVPSAVSSMSNAQVLSVYAHSTVSGKETQLTIPIKIGQVAAPVQSAPTAPDPPAVAPETVVIVNPPEGAVGTPSEIAPGMPPAMLPEEDEEGPPPG
jgi:hypothetical protein